MPDLPAKYAAKSAGILGTVPLVCCIKKTACSCTKRFIGIVLMKTTAFFWASL